MSNEMFISLNDFGIDNKYLAHTPDELLQEHLDLTKEYFLQILEAKNLETIVEDIINHIDKENALLIKEMFYNAVYLHDLGKKNPYFQIKKMKNPLFKEYESCSDSSHSHQGALEYIAYYRDKLESISDNYIYFRLVYILYGFAYQIEKHHGRLGAFESFLEKKKEQHSSFFNVKEKLQNYFTSDFSVYILNKLLFSLLISSDYYATIEYMADFKVQRFGLLSDKRKAELNERFQHFISRFPKPEGINVLRNEMFLEAEKNLLENLDKNIFYLEAPTGSGKTITSINLALKLLQNDTALNKVFYIFPFNTLVEQTKNVFEEIFGDSLDMQVINSVTPLPEPDQEEEESKYEKSYMSRLFYHSECIVTTHVRLFDILFGTGKEENFPLWQLANSVVIIDEIQSYNNALWWYMIAFFEKYAKTLNIKFIIMSATLPKLDYFLTDSRGFVDLIHRRDYFFQNPYFKDRVKVDFSLLDEGKIDFYRLEEILEEVHEKYPKVLFEFIKKQSAREFYERINGLYDYVYELSGDDNKAYRQYVINKTKENKPIILVATQVIEAGVDIDMDCGFKDISTLDSEEQFMGRVNRSCKKEEAIVYFFDMDDASKIYKGDHRVGFDLKQERFRKILKTKAYRKFYEPVLKEIEKAVLSYDQGLQNNIEYFYEYIRKLNFQEIAKIMTLIDSQNFILYFPFQIDIAKYKGVDEFENIDQNYLTNGKLDGMKVWKAFLRLNEIENFTKKAYEKAHINTLMQFFTFSIVKYDPKSHPCIGEEVGGYYFVEDYEPFITKEAKFDRQAYDEKCHSIFL